MTPKRISSFISRIATISLFLLLPATHVAAQNKPKTPNKPKTQTAVAEKDTIAFFRGIAVSADLVGAAERALSDYGQFEAALRINLRDKYFPVIELGYGSADADDPSTRLAYKTSAPYGRIGLDINIAKNKHDDYRIYAGARYALTYYKFDVIGEGLKDPVWGDDVRFEAHDVEANCHWLEAVFGVDAKIVCSATTALWAILGTYQDLASKATQDLAVRLTLYSNCKPPVNSNYSISNTPFNSLLYI